MDDGWQRSAWMLSVGRVSVLERAGHVEGENDPIVLMHGLVAEGDSFRKLMQELPRDRRVVAVDLPGAGYSERPTNTDVSFTGMAAAVRELVRALGMKRIVLLGHSHSGAVALRFSVDYPELLRGLILLCPAHPFSRKEERLVAFYLSAPGRAFAHILPKLPRWVLLQAFRRMPGKRDGVGHAEIEPYVHTLRGPGTVAHALRLLTSWKADMAALGADLRATKVALPVLAIWGERDIVVPARSAPALMACLPQGESVVMQGVGHVPNEESPAECVALLRAWLDRFGSNQLSAPSAPPDPSEGIGVSSPSLPL